MSSKKQFRDALKREKQYHEELEKKVKAQTIRIAVLDEINLRLKLKNIELKRKRQWWKFWKRL